MTQSDKEIPLVSVLIPAYKNASYLWECLSSVLLQEYPNFEVIVVYQFLDAGSERKLKKLELACPQIRVVKDTNSKNLSESLNLGLKHCRGKYVSRLDSDDLMLPGRLNHQTKFMESNPDHVVVGGQRIIIDSNSNFVCLLQDYPITYKSVDRRLRLWCPVAHPSSMIRVNELKAIGGYDIEQECVEDWELWLRIRKQGKIANLPGVYLAYRIHDSNKTKKDELEMSFWEYRALQKNTSSLALSSERGSLKAKLIVLGEKTRTFVSHKLRRIGVKRGKLNYSLFLSQVKSKVLEIQETQFIRNLKTH